MMKNSEFKPQISPKWIQRMLQLAKFVASWSKDPSTKVGAVIVRGNALVSMGYNGFPRRVRDELERLADRETRLLFTVHAELNAILQAKRDLEGMALISTHAPCPSCAAAIAQSGIREVYFEQILPHWHWESSKKIFEEAGIYYLQISSEGEADGMEGLPGDFGL